MKKNILIYFSIFVSCNQASNNDADNDLQRLTFFLPTANWQVTFGKDTSYIYFSRQPVNNYKTYEYKLSEGDSSITQEGTIDVSSGSVNWNWNSRVLSLEQIVDSKSTWKEKSSGRVYVLEKITDSLLQLSSSEKNWIFKKTLPLSTFLVRAKYDFKHGTKLLDSLEVAPKKIIKK